MNSTTPLTVLLWAIPAVLAISMIEALVLHFRQPGSYDWRAAGVSVADLLLRRAMAFIPLSLAAPVFRWAYEYRLFEIDLAVPAMVLLLFFGQELCYYAYHRSAHRMRWFWATHAVHHSPNQLNLAAAYRLGLTGRLTGTTVFFTPLVLLGFPPQVVIATLALNLLYQFWLHATWIPKLGFLEGWINTPSAHRVHHARNVEYLDANYGGVLLVFDRLFGTYRPERADLPCDYGLVERETSHNPLVVELRPWALLGRDLWRAARQGSLRGVLGYLVMPPGWRHDGPGHTTEDLRRAAGHDPHRPTPGAVHRPI